MTSDVVGTKQILLLWIRSNQSAKKRIYTRSLAKFKRRKRLFDKKVDDFGGLKNYSVVSPIPKVD